MGFLADVGRSTAGQTGHTIFGDVMRYKQFERRGEQDALSSARQAQQMDIQQKQLAIQEAEALRKKQVNEIDYMPKSLDKMRTEAEAKGMGETYKVLEEHLSAYIQKDKDGNRFVFDKDLKKVSEEIHKDPWKMQMAIVTSHRNQADEQKKIYESNKKWLEDNPDATLDEQKAKGEKAQIALDASKKYSSEADLQYARAVNNDKDIQKSLATKSVESADAIRRAEIADRRAGETERANAAREDSMNRRLDIMDREAVSRARKVEADGGKLSFADKEAIRSMGKQLPKSRLLAQTADKNIQKIDRMAALIDRGAGGVRGDLLAKINKVADLFRRTSPEDAKYNTLKSEMIGLAGSLRLQLGLIGQTSDRDVQIMQEAAGMATPAESQKALLAGYKQGFMQDVTNYNSDAESYSKHSDVGKDLYKPITLKTSGAPTTGAGSKFKIISVE